MSVLGRKGGSTKGPTKSRPSEKMREAAMKRWRKTPMMDQERAQLILAPFIKPDGGLFCLAPQYLAWDVGNERVSMDGAFSVEQLEAIMWWMSHMPMKG